MISPSILSADFSNLEADLKSIENMGGKWIHLDVMDGHFVPNITFGPPIIKSLRKKSKLFFDCHLMIENPDKYLKDFAEAGVDLLTFHIEGSIHPHRTIQSIKDLGMKAGIAVNPGTSLDSIKWILGDLDLVLLMSVNPGFPGQKFIETTLKKAHKLREIISIEKYKALIEIDGGINELNIEKIKAAGGEVFVAGQAIFGAKNPEEAFKKLEELSN